MAEPTKLSTDIAPFQLPAPFLIKFQLSGKDAERLLQAPCPKQITVSYNFKQVIGKVHDIKLEVEQGEEVKLTGIAEINNLEMIEQLKKAGLQYIGI